MTIGQTIKTVYGTCKIAKINKSSVIVETDNGHVKVDMRQVTIMNG
jgi:hypothetical protein